MLCFDLNMVVEEKAVLAAGWFFSRKEIEENSASRRDGIPFNKETSLRKSYSCFLQRLGISLKIPQQTIATAILFCHRFFLRQSHAKNDRWTIATVCMFLAAKVEETPRSLVDVIYVSHQIIHNTDKPAALQWIRNKELYQRQKDLILLGETLVLATLDFDLTVYHPYKPLVLTLEKLGVRHLLLKVAWNFVNDSLRTSIGLQYKAPQIAAGAIFMAAKFVKVELPFEVDKVLVEEFDITQGQLGDICNQILELYNCRAPKGGTNLTSAAMAA